MQVDFNTLPEIFLHMFGFFALYYLLYRKYIYSILDPVLLYIIGLSFSSVLVINVLSAQPKYIYHFVFCHIFFLAGFATIIEWLKRYRKPNVYTGVSSEFFDYYTLRLTVYVLFGIYFLANMVLLYTTGFALLSDDPTLAKVENFTKGYGIIQVINWGIGGFILPAILFFVLYKPRRIDYFLMMILLTFTALEGSKSALLRIVIMLFLWLNHPLFRGRKDILKKVRLFAPVGILASIVVVFTVLSKENANSEEAGFAFIRRLIYGADSILTFYLPVNEQYFSRIRFWDYPSHFFNQILAFLRIVPNREAFGNVMVANAFPDRIGTIVGPNTPYYIEGQIFFGYYGAFVYSLIVGVCYGLIREYFFNVKQYSAFWLVLTCCICQQAGALHAEVTYFVISAFYSCFFVIPVYLIVSLATRGKIVFKKVQFI